eukprot:scaffold1047_cov54-Phaeocystis_antarctica.AAC.1
MRQHSCHRAAAWSRRRAGRRQWTASWALAGAPRERRGDPPAAAVRGAEAHLLYCVLAHSSQYVRPYRVAHGCAGAQVVQRHRWCPAMADVAAATAAATTAVELAAGRGIGGDNGGGRLAARGCHHALNSVLAALRSWSADIGKGRTYGTAL